MGLLNGQVSFLRFKVNHAGQNDLSMALLNKAFVKTKAKSLLVTAQGLVEKGGAEVDPRHSSKVTPNYQEEYETRAGWVIPRRLEDDQEWQVASANSDDPYWDLSACQTAGGLLLRMRIDQKKVPSTYLKEHCQQALKNAQASELKKNSKTPRKSLSPQEKKMLFEEIKRELLCRALPVSTHIDVFWDLENEDLYLFSTSTKAKNLLMHLFQRTFSEKSGLKLTLTPHAPLDQSELTKGSGKIKLDYARIDSLVPLTW